jgi:hypothetical protein
MVAAGCGGGGTPASPTTSTQPPPPPTNTWSAAGRVTDLNTGQGIGGATLTPGWSLAAVKADTDGNYMLGDVANPPTTPYPVTVSADGMINHDVWITWARGPRTGVDIDLIRDAAPFSMDFYRQFVRDTFDNDNGAPFPVLRWTTAPSFYVHLDQTGKPIEPTEVLPVTLDAIRRAVPLFTGGLYQPAAIEVGTDVRPPTPGWINVDIVRVDVRTATSIICGQAFIGANPGTITLYYDACPCTGNKVPGDVTVHEVGHALGFFHVSDKASVMYPQILGNCPRPGSLSAAELFHAKIAYSRPRGNTDPDHNPSNAGTLKSVDPRILVQ